jgi:hypothetical protein
MKVKPLWIGLGVAAVVVIGLLAFVLLRPSGRPVKPASAASASVASTVPPQAVPFGFASNTAQADVSLKLPDLLANDPELHARLYAEGVKDLKGFVEGAAAAHAEDSTDTTPYAKNVTWTAAADTSKLLSLRQEIFEFTGGAHPNTTLQALLWDKSLKRPLQPAGLFRPGADLSRLDAALCQGLAEQKKQRLGSAFTPAGGDNWRCPNWADSAFVLTPSTVAGKAGGLTFLFSPCSEGACVEGPYEATVPLAAFQRELAPAYVDEFAGAPAKPAKASAAPAKP